MRGRLVVLLFVDRHTANAAHVMVEKLRREQPDHELLTIALVIDLKNVPKFLRGPAGQIIAGTYHEGAALIPPAYDPADHLILLPDWTGRLFEGYHIGDVDRYIAAVIVDKLGIVVATIQAPDTDKLIIDYLEMGS